MIRVLYIETQKEQWTEEAIESYSKKLKPLSKVQILPLKSPPFSRDKKDIKLREEERLILKNIDSQSDLILLDEEGANYTSREFSRKIQKKLETTGKDVVFVIGGAFGVTDKIKECCKEKISLSSFVLNHHVALTVLLEQIYRALTISKGIPYHNG